ncbi:MAG: SoxR reducing system RseC family protein [Candidatus Aminicenantes bacterium]|jgi:positive regulator of sigma E activity
MKDKGTVLSTENNLARVEVACLEVCQECSASSLCIGSKNATGILSVRNPLRAKAGDRVLISIPESRYSKALILLFGVLLLATLAGMGLGYWMTPVLPLSSSTSSLLGALFGIALAGMLLSLRFKKIANESLYPEIIEILHKGDSYG